MLLHHYYAVICGLCSMQFIGINAYPTINIQRLFGSGVDANRYKKSDSDLTLPQTDSDVLELEHLKNDKNNEDAGVILSGQQLQHEIIEAPAVNNADLLLPDLERQQESAADTIRSVTVAPTLTILAPGSETVGQRELEQDKIGYDGEGQHRPPMLPHNDGGKMPAGSQHHEMLASASNSPAAPSLTKPFYGAARLAFGQNPEVLPTSTSSTTTSTTTTTTITSISHTTLPNERPSERSIVAENEANTTISNPTTTIAIAASPDTATSQLNHLDQAEVAMQGLSKNIDSDMDTKEKVARGDDVIAGKLIASKSSTARRSVTLMSPKTADSLLRHHDGQYSSFDMAQYIFWTGDEVGVARAVEEFIEQGLMTRENALKFLRDIRVGIEYLQRSYSNRVFPEEMRQNNVKKSYPALPPILEPTTTTTTTTEKPFPNVHLERTAPQGIRNLGKSIDSISMWNKLQELNNEEEKQDLFDYDETAGRAKIAEFIYTEYSLEEILYKLAKVMFTQSLAHGSDEAQQELQKLTDFLEREGNLGVIPIDLQKKVLHVLLRALSDTLSEHPELLPAARLNLTSPYNRLPLHTYGLEN